VATTSTSSGTAGATASGTGGSGSTGHERAEDAPPDSGCSLGPAVGTGLGPWVLALSAALLARRRRR
jgi:hypothetical protein